MLKLLALLWHQITVGAHGCGCLLVLLLPLIVVGTIVASFVFAAVMVGDG